jgi:hypothetical protein
MGDKELSELSEIWKLVKNRIKRREIRKNIGRSFLSSR